MKREREDPFEYLGGDLTLINYTEELNSTKQQTLTKAQRNEIRKQANKKWKLMDRKVDSGKDPNPRHSLYYKQQLPLLCNPNEWVMFQTSLVQSLPVTFRLGWSCPSIVKDTIIHRMKNDFKTMKGKYIEINDKVLKEDIVKSITWMGLLETWQIAADSVTLSRNIGLEHLSSYLRNEVQLGHVVRQELASMIPGYLLKVESHHKILDICAAPGSKTEQLLSLLKLSNRDKNQVCTGMVVANDADPVRIETLRTRYQRCSSANLMITCSRAEDLHRKLGNAVFDRIVADVPCSGDGTIRKFPHIWRLFRPRMALELHTIQLQIAIASVLLLKPGGRLVYSTCSINPIEDEAVVCALLKHFKGQLQLVNTHQENLLPNMMSRPGLNTWICTRDVFVLGEPDEVARKASLDRLPPITTSMFPPTEEEAIAMHLEYCHRILPQDNDTGGFFVAVLTLSVDFDHQNYANMQKKCKSKEKEIDSIQIMKKLGYNPKSKNDIIEDQQEKTILKDYKPLSYNEYGDIIQQLHLNEKLIGDSNENSSNTPYYMYSCHIKSKEFNETLETTNKLLQQLHSLLHQTKQQYIPNSIIFGSKSSGWLKSTSSQSTIHYHQKYELLYNLLQKHQSYAIHNNCSQNSYISIVSASIKAALDTWGIPFLGILIQAGSMIASSYSSTMDSTSSTTTTTATTISTSPLLHHPILFNPISLYSLLPRICATAVVHSCTNEASKLKLPVADFQLLLKIYLNIINKANKEVSAQVNQEAIMHLNLEADALFLIKDLLCQEYQQDLFTQLFAELENTSITEPLDRDSPYSEEDMDIAWQYLSKATKQLLVQSLQRGREHIKTYHNSHNTDTMNVNNSNHVYITHILLSIDDKCKDNHHKEEISTLLPKRRLSKSDRKKLKKNHSSSKEDLIVEQKDSNIKDTHEDGNNSNQSIDDCYSPPATIILKYSYQMKSQQYHVSILTSVDTCQSYLTALTYRADSTT